MVTRTAFEATLVIGNDTSNDIEDVLVEIDIQDLGGNPANHLFAGLANPTLTGFSNGGIDGTGDVLGETTGTARWLLVPTEFAAPDVDPVKYTVGGRVRHKQQGLEVEIPLYPVEIDVYPDAKLFLDYYLQRIVYSDNPFTPDVERAEPFALGLIVRNSGNGDAENLRITSSQPEITDNQQQLLIAFEILAAQLGDQPIDEGLTVNFGDLLPGENKIARWLFQSSLQGRFTCMDVDFEHVTNLGSDSISLIKDADIHWLIHTIELASPFLPGDLLHLDDGLPDFLVDLDPLQPNPDTGDEPVCGGSAVDDVPDVFHSSEGMIDVVRTDGTVEVIGTPDPSDLVVAVRAAIATPGWNYLDFDNPSGDHELVMLNRFRGNEPDPVPAGTAMQASGRRIGSANRAVSYQVVGPGDIGNIWKTARWEPFDMPQEPQTLFRRVHVFDYFASPGDYLLELIYAKPEPEILPTDEIVSLRMGGVIGFDLDAGPDHAGKAYTLVGSTLEPLAGIKLGSVHVPLRPDAYFRGGLAGGLGDLLRGGRGTLDDRGRAKAELAIPPGCRLFEPGTKLQHALLVGAAPNFEGVSESVETILIP